ncbi:sodium-dependent transporter [Parachlamydia sp. AcF125]|uniref:sodium-dependent transporter n=1 Tax=Parachlamydia sp. AcF125 TaxID=2795736 RepID=UPI001BC9D5C1|nr:sodium-dependent transporter [Parachlamydia sp. AcF125]MBS4167591.1 hypothetical protein [Parachlamydia sp. AcF125]
MSNHSSDTWNKQSGYIWSLIGSAVGFANVLAFSAQVYKNGGGAFLIPYFIALLSLGVPMLLLEGLVGYQWKLPIVSAYGKVLGKKGKMLGWLAILSCLTIGGFYIVLTGYSVAYTYFAATNQIPEDSQTFFLHSFLKVTPSIREMGSLSWTILISTLAVCVATWFVLVRNVKDGIEKICTLFMPLMACIMAFLAVIMLCLPGGMNGLLFYLKPDFSKLLDPTLWRDVFGQLFFSLSLGLGIIVGYSRHTSQNTNIATAMIWVALGDFAVSFISGLAIFACLAHVSYVQQIPFDSILSTDSTFDIGFILFPTMLKFFGAPFSTIMGVIFFACIFIAGITGVFSIVESIAGNVEVEFAFTRKKAVTMTTAILGLFGVIFCMGNGSHIINALAPMVLGINMLIGGLALIATFQYRSKTIRENPLWYKGSQLTIYAYMLRYFAPCVLACILVGNLLQEFDGFNIDKGVRWGWLAGAVFLSACLVLSTTYGWCLRRKSLFKAKTPEAVGFE